jgi:class 3 adenylate cyclase
MESGGFERSGGVIAWSAVAPFTAMVVLQRRQHKLAYFALFIFVVAVDFTWSGVWNACGKPGRALFSDHVVEVWTWQIYLYAIATTVGVSLNAIVLMQLLIEKTENAIAAHKMLACSIMPAPVAKEVFELQWTRLRDGKKARAASAARGGRSRYAAGRPGGSLASLDGDATERPTLAQRLLGPLLAFAFGETSSDRGTSVSRSSGSVLSWCSSGFRAQGRDADARVRRSGNSETRRSVASSHFSETTQSISVDGSDGREGSIADAAGFEWDADEQIEGEVNPFSFDAIAQTHAGRKEAQKSPTRKKEGRRGSFDEGKRQRGSLDSQPGGGGGGAPSGPPRSHSGLRSFAKERSDMIARGQFGASGLGGRRKESGIRAREHADVSVVFIDIVGFSDMCKRIKPIGVLRFLEFYFEMVDRVAEEHGVTKVRTVGDGYLAVTGLMASMGVEADANAHVLRSLTFGLGVLMEIRDNGVRLPNGEPLEIRVGVAHGPVFSGVVGKTCMQYDIFGDVANLAARMEQTCPLGSVNMPAASHEKMLAELSPEARATFGDLRFARHKNVNIKNMGEVDTVSLRYEDNLDGVERLLAGAIGDDLHRSVTVHIGVMAGAARLQPHGEYLGEQRRVERSRRRGRQGRGGGGARGEAVDRIEGVRGSGRDRRRGARGSGEPREVSRRDARERVVHTSRTYEPSP